MMEFDPAEFGKAMGVLVRDATAPLLKRIEALEGRQPERGEKGDPGDPGADAEPVLVADVVAELVKSDALAPVLDLYVAEAVAKHFEAHPVRDGRDGDTGPQGAPGADGKSVTIEDVSLFLDAAIAKHVLELERRATDTITKAIERLPVPKDGKDGVDFSDVTIEYDGERAFTIKGRGGEIVKRLPIPMDKGYWREGMACEKSDIVTHDGTAWIALQDTKSKPCLENKEEWRLFARKGRDGTHGRNGVDKTAPAKLKGKDDA